MWLNTSCCKIHKFSVFRIIVTISLLQRVEKYVSPPGLVIFIKISALMLLCFVSVNGNQVYHLIRKNGAGKPFK